MQKKDKQHLNNMSFFLSLIKQHNEKCSDISCFCQHVESIIWIIKRAKESGNENFADIYEDELLLLNSINKDIFMPMNDKTDAGFTQNVYLLKTYEKIENVQTKDENT